MTPLRVLVVPDSHHPFVHRPSWKLMLKVADWFKPDDIVVLGDFGDCVSVNGHAPSGLMETDLRDEAKAVNKALDELDALGASRKIFIAGNHEDRIDRYLAQHAPALFTLVRVEKLYQLEERGWEYVPYKEAVQVGDWYFTHDTGAAGINAHRGAAIDFKASVGIGHTHRMAIEYTGVNQRKPIAGAMFGWLGDDKAATYAPAVKRAQWVRGFGIGYLVDGTLHAQTVPILGGRCVVEGQVFSA